MKPFGKFCLYIFLFISVFLSIAVFMMPYGITRDAFYHYMGHNFFFTTFKYKDILDDNINGTEKELCTLSDYYLTPEYSEAVEFLNELLIRNFITSFFISFIFCTAIFLLRNYGLVFKEYQEAIAEFKNIPKTTRQELINLCDHQDRFQELLFRGRCEVVRESINDVVEEEFEEIKGLLTSYAGEMKNYAKEMKKQQNLHKPKVPSPDKNKNAEVPPPDKNNNTEQGEGFEF